MDQKVLPVISDFKTFDMFLASDIKWCILMDFHISVLADLIHHLHEKEKYGILHMDLVHGLTADEAGTQYVCQKLHVDGVISTKAKVIETANKNHTLSIMRLFMIDSRSIEKGCELGKRLQPDYIEVLPANTKHGIAYVKAQCSIALIAGGLIQNEEDITACLQDGVCAVTTSKLRLCETYIVGGKL